MSVIFFRLLWSYNCDLARDSHGRTPTQLAMCLSEILSMDIFPIWEEALQRLGIDVNCLISRENSLLHVSGASGAKTEYTERVEDGLRYRKRLSQKILISEQRLYSDDEWICECMFCSLRGGFKGYKPPDRTSRVITDSRFWSTRPNIYKWVLAQQP